MHKNHRLLLNKQKEQKIILFQKYEIFILNKIMIKNKKKKNKKKKILLKNYLKCLI